MSFEDTSRAIAKEFLQTAVVVDDGLYSKDFEDTSPPEEIVDPTELPLAATNPPEQVLMQPAPVSRKTLDADAVMQGFFNQGIICATIRPTQDSPVTSPFYFDLLQKADLVVLDWNLVDTNGADDGGEQAKDVIKKLVTGKGTGSRFRVIIVYTGGTELAVADQAITDLLAVVGFQTVGAVHRKDHTVIAVFAKNGGAVAEQDEARQFGEAELGSKCVDIFAEATRGLLSNAVLKGLALIRGESHRLLGRFSEKCDPAFLFHRMLTSPPSDVEDQVIPLIVSEIESILFELRASEAVSLERAEEYLDYRCRADKLRTAALSDNAEATIDCLKTALNKGLEAESIVSTVEALRQDAYIDQSGKKTFDLKLADLFCQVLSGANDPDRESLEELAMLMSIQQRYGNLPPVLGPGTIVQEDSRYWLCVQPACDSVRITSNRVFPFLKMSVATHERFDYVIAASTGKVKLRVNKRLYDGTMVKFKPSDGLVRARHDNGKFLFESVADQVVDSGKMVTRKFDFVAQLKVLHSIRETDRMTNELGRIGLTESEWSRRASSASRD